MARKQLLGMCIAGLFAAAAAGCGDKDKGMAMTGEYKPAQRPAELDKLNDLVGNWTFEMSCNVDGMDKPMSSTGTSTVNWEVDRWCLVEKVDGTAMMGSGMFHGMGVYTYDPRARMFKTAWMDNEGSVHHGTMKETGPRTWKTSGGGENVVTGEKVKGEGTMRFIDNNTLEWTGTMYSSSGKKMMDMKGTSRRKM